MTVWTLFVQFVEHVVTSGMLQELIRVGEEVGAGRKGEVRPVTIPKERVLSIVIMAAGVRVMHMLDTGGDTAMCKRLLGMLLTLRDLVRQQGWLDEDEQSDIVEELGRLAVRVMVEIDKHSGMAEEAMEKALQRDDLPSC